MVIIGFLSEINYLKKKYEINQEVKNVVYYIGNKRIYILFELRDLM